MNTELRSPPPGTHDGSGAVDGRTLRRERGRAAVTQAMIDLVVERHVPPTTEQLAERAGVSVASVFRYFDGLDDLRREAAMLYLERYDHLFTIPEVGVGGLADRIARFVTARVRLYATAEPMGRLMRARAQDDALASENLERLRTRYADQIRQHFDPEFAARGGCERDDVVVVIATLTSFESWDQSRHHHARTDAQIRRAWHAALVALLGAAS